MRRDVMRALVAVELRRAYETYRRFVASMAGVLGLFWVLGWLTPTRGSMVLSVLGFALLMQGAMRVFQDKLDGSLEFLRALPVPASDLAVGRLVGTLLTVLPAPVVLTAAVYWGYADSLPWGVAFIGVGLFVLTTLAALLGTGATMRFDARHTFGAVVVLILVVGALDELGSGFLPDVVKRVDWLVRQPWLPPALQAAAWLALAGGVWLSFHWTRVGIERFTPGKDQIRW